MLWPNTSTSTSTSDKKDITSLKLTTIRLGSVLNEGTGGIVMSLGIERLLEHCSQSIRILDLQNCLECGDHVANALLRKRTTPTPTPSSGKRQEEGIAASFVADAEADAASGQSSSPPQEKQQHLRHHHHCIRHHLQELNLENTGFSDKGAMDLALAISNGLLPQLTTLDLRHNTTLTELGIVAILQALRSQKHRRLQHLYLEGSCGGGFNAKQLQHETMQWINIAEQTANHDNKQQQQQQVLRCESERRKVLDVRRLFT